MQAEDVYRPLAEPPDPPLRTRGAAHVGLSRRGMGSGTGRPAILFYFVFIAPTQGRRRARASRAVPGLFRNYFIGFTTSIWVRCQLDPAEVSRYRHARLLTRWNRILCNDCVSQLGILVSTKSAHSRLGHRTNGRLQAVIHIKITG